MIDTLTLTPIAVPRTSDGPDARDFVSATAAGSAGRTPLLAAHHRAQVGIINLAALDIRIHKRSHSAGRSTRSIGSLSFSHAAGEFIPGFPAPFHSMEPGRPVCVRIAAAAPAR